MKHRLLSVPPLVLAATLLACSSSPTEPKPKQERVGHASSPVINGTNSTAAQDAVVLLIHYDPSAGDVASCTGTLISPRLVLTARHCVADTDESAACDVDGTPLAQGVVRGNHPANTMYVFTGPQRPDFGSADITPAGVGLKVLDDGGDNLCNHDIALVLLKEPVANAKILPLRLDAPILPTDILTAIGWGVTDSTPSPDTRQQRSGIKILEIGPNATGDLPIPANEFQVGESICSGDSGGPAIAASGAIVGVVSRGGNGTKPNPQDPSSGCVGSKAENIYTKLAPFKDFILKGFELAEAEPWYENGTDPRLAPLGAGCTDPAQCRSNICLVADSNPDALKAPATPDTTDCPADYASVPQGKACTSPTTYCHFEDFGDCACTGAADAPTWICNPIKTCAADCSTIACPDGQTCNTEGDVKVCRPPAPAAAPTTTTKKSGCATSPGTSSSNGALGIVLAVLGLVALLRKKLTAHS